jgi:Ca2+-binding EF-hand superfamily protein
VLIKTLYYPSTETDTLDRKTVLRDSYMVSVFDEDTNHDGYINQNDFRRFYHFALPSLEKTPLVPKNHTVLSAEYDPKNDWMYAFTRHDINHNGKVDNSDPWHVFWIDMKNPRNNGQML